MHKSSIFWCTHAMKPCSHCILQLGGLKTEVQNILLTEFKLHA